MHHGQQHEHCEIRSGGGFPQLVGRSEHLSRQGGTHHRDSPCPGQRNAVPCTTHQARIAGSFGPAEEQAMDIKRSGSQHSGKGPADWFTGTVRIDPLHTAPDPARCLGAGHLRARGAHSVAYASAGADAGCDDRFGPRSTRRRTGRGDTPRRGHLVSTRRKTLTWRLHHDRNEPYRHPGTAGWQERRLVGTRVGCPVRLAGIASSQAARAAAAPCLTPLPQLPRGG